MRLYTWSWCLLSIAVMTALLRAADGTLDPTFGVGGKVKTNFVEGVSFDDAQDIVIQGDGKIVIVGSVSGVKGVTAVALARYMPNGSLDPTFGDGGRVATGFVSSGSRATGVALQSDGKIVVIGNANGATTSQDFVVTRYHADGAVDTTFGTNGLVMTDFGNTIDNARDVVIRNDGRIIVVGGAFIFNRRIEIACYTPDGALDPSFSGDGKLVTTIGVDAMAVTMQADGKMLVAGSAATAVPGDNDFVVARFEPDGSLDTGFGIGGRVTADFDHGSDAASAVLIQSDGRIVVTGTATEKGNTQLQFGLVRYHTDGTLDTTFGEAGRVITDLGSRADRANDAALLADSRIVVAGTSENEFAIVRYSIDGLVDRTFGVGGVVRAEFSTPTAPETADQGTALAIQGDGKIVVAGTSIDTRVLTSDAALLRLGSE